MSNQMRGASGSNYYLAQKEVMLYDIKAIHVYIRQRMDPENFIAY
jgi:hypothetical protein